MPIRKPTGAISSVVISIFTGSGSPTPASLIGAAMNASSDTAMVTESSTNRKLAPEASRATRLLKKLPSPLDTSMENMMIVSAYVGCPRNSTNFWINATWIRM